MRFQTLHLKESKLFLTQRISLRVLKFTKRKIENLKKQKSGKNLRGKGILCYSQKCSCYFMKISISWGGWRHCQKEYCSFSYED